jgi:hypothetical protein
MFGNNGNVHQLMFDLEMDGFYSIFGMDQTSMFIIVSNHQANTHLCPDYDYWLDFLGKVVLQIAIVL